MHLTMNVVEPGSHVFHFFAGHNNRMTQRPQRRKREVDVVDEPVAKKPKPMSMSCSVTQDDDLQLDDIDVENDEEELVLQDPSKTKMEDILRNWVCTIAFFSLVCESFMVFPNFLLTNFMKPRPAIKIRDHIARTEEKEGRLEWRVISNDSTRQNLKFLTDAKQIIAKYVVVPKCEG